MLKSETVSIRESIISAAYECFDRYGFEKTTIGDIATAASIARSTLYKEFKNKEEIIVSIVVLETRGLSKKIDALWKSKRKTKDVSVDSIYLVLKEAKENKYIDYLHKSDHLLRIVADPMMSDHKASYELLREVWSEALAPHVNSIKNDDRAFDDLMAWVTFRISILMKLVDVADLSEERTKDFIRRFALGRG